MRSVCLEMSSNMFMILFRVEIDYLSRSQNFSLRKIRSLRGSRCLVELSRRQRGARGCLQNKKNLLILITILFGYNECSDRVSSTDVATKFTTPF